MSRSSLTGSHHYFRLDKTSPVSPGFTLLEVMIAMSIIAIAFTSLFGSQSRSLSLAAEAKFNTVAALLVQEKFAEYEAGLIPLESDEGDFGEAFPGFTWQSEVGEVDLGQLEGISDLEPPLQRVELTVSWQEGQFTTTMSYFAREQEER